MNKAEKRFRLYAVLSVFILLTVLLSVINGVNFTMVSEDADRLTAMIADQSGTLGPEGRQGQGAEVPVPGGFIPSPMGPGSPEMNASLRYFTISFTDKGKVDRTVAFRTSAVTEEEAREWAKSLLGESTGWTRTTYRYRVYEHGKRTFVTVIDQSRELTPSYRTLAISAVGELVCLAISFIALKIIGKKIFSPLVEADRKQKRFIADANREFRVPLTVIGGNTELLERAHGPSEETVAIRRQVSKMDELVGKLEEMSIWDEGGGADAPLSDILISSIEKERESFVRRGITAEVKVAPGIRIKADPSAVSEMTDELVSNAVRYAQSRASFSLTGEGGRVTLVAKNDATLPDGQADNAFDRFTKLPNGDPERPGVGLSLVKDFVKSRNGRVTAFVSEGIFTVKISL